MRANRVISEQLARRAISAVIGAIPATVVASYASFFTWNYAIDGTSQVFAAVGSILAVGAIWGTAALWLSVIRPLCTNKAVVWGLVAGIIAMVVGWSLLDGQPPLYPTGRYGDWFLLAIWAFWGPIIAAAWHLIATDALR